MVKYTLCKIILFILCNLLNLCMIDWDRQLPFIKYKEVAFLSSALQVCMYSTILPFKYFGLSVHDDVTQRKILRKNEIYILYSLI